MLTDIFEINETLSHTSKSTQVPTQQNKSAKSASPTSYNVHFFGDFINITIHPKK